MASRKKAFLATTTPTPSSTAMTDYLLLVLMQREILIVE